jgi:hypothetical protein
MGVMTPLGRVPLALLVDQGCRWVKEVRGRYDGAGEAVSLVGPPGLEDYFPPEVLARTRIILVAALPEWPLLRLLPFPPLPSPGGLTLGDLLFIRSDPGPAPAIVFHGMVHAVQWAVLGTPGFIGHHLGGMVDGGHRRHSLEGIAFQLTGRYLLRPGDPFDVEAEVRARLSPGGPQREGRS